ncbi:hypothetical protein SteCoe_33619 [Stentor coeruleus]|uniref:Uncharacterized protein n=1 Tax=Stentor coeruleus TaxID=5963 RepID=A0A1R2AWK5_9CILI|nr:hypothetical protein SteCoe_33619 [Stentor coeruleus]
MLLVILSIAWAFDVIDVKVANDHGVLSLSSGCQAFHLGINFQRTEVHFWPNSDGKISWIHYSDILYEKCDNKCPSDSVLCGEISESTTSEVIIGACVGDLYIYVKTTAKASLTIASNYLDEKCDHIVENLYTKCGSMNYEECDKCGDDCRLAECIREKRSNEDEKLIMSLCLPYNVSDDELNSRCSGHINVDSGKWKKDCSDSIYIGSIGAGTIIALVIIMMAFFGFVGVVTWYNLKIKTTGHPPITCPRFCPEILFPRANVERRMRTEESTYRPPEIALQVRKK